LAEVVAAEVHLVVDDVEVTLGFVEAAQADSDGVALLLDVFVL
jgi:hypothetical protein